MNNLLNITVIGGILRSTWTWRLLRLLMLALLCLMIAYGWHQHAIPGVDVKDPLMYANFTTLNLWVVWMMGMVVIALVLGRAWCTVCPVGWLNGLVSRFGLRKAMPAWLNNFVPVTLVLLLLQLLVYFYSIHRFPDYSALLLLWMIVLAVAAGLIFQRRSFCLLLCPAGAVFSLYARLAPWQLRVKKQSVCAGCHEKPCISTQTAWKRASLGSLQLSWRSPAEGCPVDLVPAEIEDSSACTLCMNCVQTCCNDNLKLGFRPWPGDLKKGSLSPGEAFFFLVLLGLLTANFSKVYVALREAVFWLPENLALSLGWDAAGFYPLAVLWVALLFPLLILLPGMLVYFLCQVKVQTFAEKPQPEISEGNNNFSMRSIMALVGRMALAVLPMVLAAHLALAVVKLNAKLGYLPLTLQDSSGVKSFLAINVMNTLSPPGVLVSLDIIKWVVLFVLLVGAAVTVASAWIVAGKESTQSGPVDRAFFAASLVTLLVLAGFYGSTVIEWLFVR